MNLLFALNITTMKLKIQLGKIKKKLTCHIYKMIKRRLI